LRRGLFIAAAAAALLGVPPAAAHAAFGRTEVVVELAAPPLARAMAQSRVLSLSARRQRLSLRSPTSAGYLARLATAQRAVADRISRAVPSARIRWRYRIVLDGLAVDVPRTAVSRLRLIHGVAAVTEGIGYRRQLDRSAPVIDAPFLWGPTFSTVGQGMKIAIVDDGVDQTHPFFDPAGFTMPAGFPKGQTSFTTAKVIVARAFPPPHAGYAPASRPFDAALSFHATHVAGIAAGDRGTAALGRKLSGIAPGAYIGNYKVLTVPAASYNGLNGNSPEIAAAIESAVRDGMDVINLSIGEPEVTPSRDLAVRAVNAAFDAGVVVTISAGNSNGSVGRGSIWSPATTAKAIAAAAADDNLTIAGFSSSGPTPLSLLMKPDVTAPGVAILSSVVQRDGTWDAFSGTSMAAPHVAGAAALLLQRHPTWTPAQVKSALVQTGQPVTRGGTEAPTTREGGGMIELEAADNPLLFAAPTGLSFGLLRPGRDASRRVTLTDAGGGAGDWTVDVAPQPSDGQVTVRAASSVTVPGTLAVTAAAGTTEGDATGFILLTRGGEVRRIPYWLRVAGTALARQRHRTLARAGNYRGDTRGKPALVTTYRYPDDPSAMRVPRVLAGPEQVFRLKLKRPVANFGVRLLGQSRGAAVEPRVVVAGNENRLTGEPALPIVVNAYLRSYHSRVPAVGALLPAKGAYDVVFDSPDGAGAGPFRFRLWINDVTPPSLKLLTRSVGQGGQLRLRVADRGAGVWPESLTAQVDGRSTPFAFAGGRVTVPTRQLTAGVHRLALSASDWQESRNTENAYRILGNTRTLRTTFRVR
jgi:subtilisin family serine protease